MVWGPIGSLGPQRYYGRDSNRRSLQVYLDSLQFHCSFWVTLLALYPNDEVEKFKKLLGLQPGGQVFLLRTISMCVTFWLSVNQLTLSFFSFDLSASSTILTAQISHQVELHKQ